MTTPQRTSLPRTPELSLVPILTAQLHSYILNKIKINQIEIVTPPREIVSLIKRTILLPRILSSEISSHLSESLSLSTNLTTLPKEKAIKIKKKLLLTTLSKEDSKLTLSKELTKDQQAYPSQSMTSI